MTMSSVQYTQWPLQSLDLNPTGHLWDVVKEQNSQSIFLRSFLANSSLISHSIVFPKMSQTAVHNWGSLRVPITLWLWLEVHVKSILNVCSEFVTPQKKCVINHPAKFECLKKHQVYKIRYQNLEKNKQYSLLSDAGGVSTGGDETTPTHRKAAISLNGLPLAANFKRRPSCFVNDRNQVLCVYVTKA